MIGRLIIKYRNKVYSAMVHKNVTQDFPTLQ
nr:MAG TPA: hypothetical protein [Caudoviricetes sp.]